MKMSLTLKIFLFALILVQTTAEYESMESLPDGMISGLLKPRDKREIQDKLVFGQSNEIYGNRIEKREEKNKKTPKDGEEKAIQKSELNDAKQNSSNKRAEISNLPTSLYDVYNVLTAGKIDEFLYNVKHMINNHRHLEGIPRIFTNDRVRRSVRKLLSVEDPEKTGNDTKEKEDRTQFEFSQDSFNFDARLGLYPDISNMNEDEQLNLYKNAAGHYCRGDICKKPKEHGLKRILTFPSHIVGGLRRKLRLLKKALKNSKILRLVGLLESLKSIDRTLTKFELQLPRIRPGSLHTMMKSSEQEKGQKRKKRFIFKNKKKEMEGLKVDKELTQTKIQGIINTLRHYNLESERLIIELIVLVGDLRNVEHLEKQFPHAKTILHIPKTLIHDYPSLFLKVMRELIGKVGDVKTDAKRGVRKMFKVYDRFSNHVRNHRLSKAKFLYKLMPAFL